MISNTFIILLVILLSIDRSNCSQCPKNAEEFLVTFHPHLDAFWIDTDDDLKDVNFEPVDFLYAINQRNAKVLLNSMLESLTQNEKRKHFITEVVFFKDWFEYIDQNKKQQVRKLLQKGQFEIVNGGWVQNDEAVCYIDDILDQYTLGNNYLYSQFKIKSQIGWATDSFGHSNSQVAIQHLLGFQFQGIQRIDDRYIYQRNNDSLLEFYWSPVSDSNNKKYGGVFTHIRHFLHEVNDFRTTKEEKIIGDFEKIKKNMEKLYKTNKYFRFLGNDFQEFIPQQFQILERSFQRMNKKAQCPVYKYGNPSDYLQRLKELYKDKISARQYDFMPNFAQDHYWSGYYTTNPELKKICKDYSRLVNLFRKIYIKYLTDGGNSIKNINQLIVKSDQLLSVMQHHDGITATSKYYIQELFVKRMEEKTNQIINAITELKQYPKQNCKFYQGRNICQIDSEEDKIYFSIIHQGGQKKQRIQFSFKKDIYEIADDENDEVFCNPINKICNLVYYATLKSGENVFLLEKSDKSKALKTIKSEGNSYKDNDLSISISEGNKITYNFNDEQINIAYVKSSNQKSQTTTHTWNKYGERQDKTQIKIPGIYIMANSGSLTKCQLQLNTIYVTKGKVFTRINIPGNQNQVTITIKNREKHIIELETRFKPFSQDAYDYFIQVGSKLDSKGQFYHDSNGYLVNKRKVGTRPDYNWQYKPEDKINANTYPMCSFAYAIQGEKKLVFFTDRAQGFTQFDKSYLINIDRLADDDSKGVGEVYRIVKQNIFHHKIGLFKSNYFIERQWQKSYDQPLLGFYSKDQRSSSKQSSILKVNQFSNYLKYTVFILNQDQYVLRLFNLAEKMEIKLPKYLSKYWNIPELDLKLKFGDIKESFANGIEQEEKTLWTKIEGQINMFNADKKDSQQSIIFSPLQVKSFRINLKGKPVEDLSVQQIPAKPIKQKENSISTREKAQESSKPTGNESTYMNQAKKIAQQINPLLNIQLTDVRPILKSNCK